MAAIEEKRKSPRHETLFAAKLACGGKTPLEGDVINVSKCSLFLLTSATELPTEGALVGVSMRLGVGWIHGATVDLEATGRVVRVERTDEQIGIALQFDRDLGINFDPEAGRAFLEIPQELAIDVAGVLVTVAGELTGEQAETLGARLRTYAEEHSTKMVVDMSRVTYLSQSAMDCLEELQREFRGDRGYLRIVCPRVVLANGPVSDDLRRFAQFRRRGYPSLYHAFTA